MTLMNARYLNERDLKIMEKENLVLRSHIHRC